MCVTIRPAMCRASAETSVRGSNGMSWAILNRPWQFGHCGVFGAIGHPHCGHLYSSCFSSACIFSSVMPWRRQRPLEVLIRIWRGPVGRFGCSGPASSRCSSSNVQMTCPRSLCPATTMFTAPDFCLTTAPSLNFLSAIRFSPMLIIVHSCSRRKRRLLASDGSCCVRLDRAEGLSMAALGGCVTVAGFVRSQVKGRSFVLEWRLVENIDRTCLPEASTRLLSQCHFTQTKAVASKINSDG